VTMIPRATALESATLPTAASHATLPNAFGLGAALIVAGLFLVLAAFRVNGLGFENSALWLYSLGLTYIGVLTFWESTRLRAGALPSWTSPPALIAGWALAWIYAPALAPFFDSSLLGNFETTQGGEAVLMSGLLLTCVALTALSLSFHLTSLALGRRAGDAGNTDRAFALQRLVGLYLVSTAVRGFHLRNLGVAYGSDLTAWGSLEPLAQWIGYVEDLRYLALALLVAHVVRRRTGYVWLGMSLFVELMLGVSSGFLTPVIMPVVLCIVTAVVFDRLRARYVLLLLMAVAIVATLVPVVRSIRQDQQGVIGTREAASAADALAAPRTYWLGGLSSLDTAYRKFFGRQSEVASATGLVMALTPAVVPYEGFERFLTLPSGLIPRALWPDKPTLSRGVWFSSTFRGLEEDTTSYSAMTIFSEGYLFYGWTGALVAMVITGAVLAVLRRRLDNSRLALVYLALVPTILQIEPEFSSYLITLAQRAVVFAATFIVLTYTRKMPLTRSTSRP